MSDQDYAKKKAETNELNLFIEAYEYSIGIKLEILQITENPDFICLKSDGSSIGVELTKVMRDPRDALWDRIIHRKYEMDYWQFLETLNHLIQKKEKARSKRYIKQTNNNILVLQMFDNPLSNVMQYFKNLSDDFQDHGFQEIWLADYFELEAYDDIELYCLYPIKLFGYYERPWPERKPYG